MTHFNIKLSGYETISGKWAIDFLPFYFMWIQDNIDHELAEIRDDLL